MPKALTYSQRRVLAELKTAGAAGLRRSCTNSTLCALERRGLARWDLVGVESRHGVVYEVDTWWAVEQQAAE
jgi:hypothetical protein